MSPTMDWTDIITEELLEIYQNVRVHRLQNGNLRATDYKVVARELISDLGRTGELEISSACCKNKIENLKRKYQQELKKIKTSDMPSKWTWFDRMNDQLSGLHRYSSLPGESTTGSL
jgi:hypothetical protein